MNNKYLPTKTNLIKIKDTIKLSKQGQDLLEKKKIILQKEKEKYLKKMQELKQENEHIFKEGYEALKNANVDVGLENVKEISEGLEIEDSLDIKYKIIMGVEIPSIVYENKNKMNYEIYSSTISVDETFIKFNKIKENIIELVQIESTVYRLEKNIQKVQSRSNALKNVIIPQYRIIEEEIQNSLEEKEREEFARLKIIKKR